MCVCVCVCERERERERERDSDTDIAKDGQQKTMRQSACMHMCVC